MHMGYICTYCAFIMLIFAFNCTKTVKKGSIHTHVVLHTLLMADQKTDIPLNPIKTDPPPKTQLENCHLMVSSEHSYITKNGDLWELKDYILTILQHVKGRLM